MYICKAARSLTLSRGIEQNNSHAVFGISRILITENPVLNRFMEVEWKEFYKQLQLWCCKWVHSGFESDLCKKASFPSAIARAKKQKKNKTKHKKKQTNKQKKNQ